MDRKLRMGMVGGGRDSMMGPIHRAAAEAEGRIELTAGAFSSTRPKSQESGALLGLASDRVYGVYRDMFRREAKLPATERIDFVSIVTPSNMHYPVAMAALDAGFHVLSEAPMTTTVDEAENLGRKLEQTGQLFCLTQHHDGYPIVEKARAIVESGQLGALRRIVVEYPQGWLATRIEAKGHKQASWRTNPRNAGGSCCMSDVAVHAESLIASITGLSPTKICADITTFVNGRMLDDDGAVLLQYEEGARASLWASQIANGERAALSIRIYGAIAKLDWQLAAPHQITVSTENAAPKVIKEKHPKIKEPALDIDIPAGHPHISMVPLINIYSKFVDAINDTPEGNGDINTQPDYPNAQDGIRSAKFTAAIIASANSKEKWITID
jgi:predicted dehydrogenase